MCYIDELSPSARAQFVAQGQSAIAGGAAVEAFRALGVEHLPTLGPEDTFDKVAGAIGQIIQPTEETAGRLVAVATLFGEDEAPRVVELRQDLFEEIETLAMASLRRIVGRISDHRATDADLAWLLTEAETLTDEMVLMANPFDGDQGDAVELRRQVVRARKPWACHWTKRLIAVGERHLAITETYEGRMLTTRHSLLSVYLDVAGEDPAVAIELAPAEHRRAA
ncbi:hypothetical protein E8E01_19405 [Methylorubrum populi]|uniref:hypothetical protein n=1 Tax=Methylorubrum populi TaxID=223967 RepID=UPI0011527D06|nr:hypothetical protein [Methylorubrum populi]QDI82429.1 hypothetical protein E8E01_19405 [Methylorubrum populi]